jgi:hypothetical protein
MEVAGLDGTEGDVRLHPDRHRGVVGGAVTKFAELVGSPAPGLASRGKPHVELEKMPTPSAEIWVKRSAVWTAAGAVTLGESVPVPVSPSMLFPQQ